MVSKFEFHCHSHYSSCSNAKIDDIIKKCSENGIEGIALTDHNEIKGAIELKNKAPKSLKVIIGEEIRTASGEIIGLFLNSKIESGLSLAKTISEIKKQSGLVILPHPFDRLRSKISLEEIEKYLSYFDIIETYNSRCVFESDNRKAKDYAKIKNKPAICGSDAHFLREFGRTIVRNVDLGGPEEFLESLKNADFEIQRTSMAFHAVTKLIKIIRKLQKKINAIIK